MSIIEKALKNKKSSLSSEPPDCNADNYRLGKEKSLLDSDPANRKTSASTIEEPADTQATSISASDRDIGGVGSDRHEYHSPINGSSSYEARRQALATSHPQVPIPFDELRDRGFLCPSRPRSRIAEEFRGIKRPVLQNIASKLTSSDSPTNLVMVTSALQGDGKTFTSINLAISVAMEQDKTVLFVDADVVRANAGKVLGVPQETRGLIDLLEKRDEVDPADVILNTNVPNLRILPAGNASGKSTELLASESMHELMVELAHRYPDRVIVFDSPPMLLTTESSVLASFMGQIIFVASADVTPQHAIEEAIEQLGEDRIAGVVLNRASRRRSKLLGIGSYGYGYGYGYGNVGYGQDREVPA